VAPDFMEEVLSSRAKLRIMDAVSVRPRTLGELSDLAGISVQGVLRHLNRLVDLGLVEERSLARAAPKARRVYAAKSTRVRDYSTGGNTVVKATAGSVGEGRGKVRDLERAAGDLLIQRRRIREEVRRLGRMIDEAADEQDNLAAAIGGLPLPSGERLILEVVLTEDTLEEGARVLAKYYGLGDRRSIETALTKAKRLVGK
jgi:DNA-binding transcriptional ArsR family regulator